MRINGFRSCHSDNFVHDSKMKIYPNLSEMMKNSELSYLCWECVKPCPINKFRVYMLYYLTFYISLLKKNYYCHYQGWWDGCTGPDKCIWPYYVKLMEIYIPHPATIPFLVDLEIRADYSYKLHNSAVKGPVKWNKININAPFYPLLNPTHAWI